ncbi:Gfo/Idh/MocA family protein [Paenibacillus alkalitolerans]|uniref:Gfo/Idh/MocA family protein n=1 Tax=Paenibacillus alkalitolerans TaxID=2799335 RepID=UPI0018F5AF20|nr:Gfo/Idh/MocA family oxidoreductase [Paenibacillus alkalitolerans]
MKKHRIVLIGHGVISKAYLKAFASIPEAEITAVVGRNAEKAAAFAAEHGIPVSGTDIAETSARSQATAAVICTPNASHYDGVMAASRSGLHCLCEKPLHISPDKQREMIASCKERGVLLAVSYMRRFIKHMCYLKELIDSGALGRIMSVDVTIKHFRPKTYYESWHGTKEIDGGGPFIQQGSHIIDLALWLNGGYQEILDAKMFQVYHRIETEDHGYAIVRYANGAVGMIEASTASLGMQKEIIEISGTQGTVTANYDEILTFHIPGMKPPTFDPAGSANEELFKQLASDFLRAIEQGRSPFIDGESAAAATEFINAIYKKAGEPVRTFGG